MVAAKKRPPGIVCPVCGGDTETSETRQGKNYIRRRRLCKDYRCPGRLTTAEVVYNGAKLDEGLVFMPRAELEHLHYMIRQCLGFPDDTKAALDGDDEPVSPSS